MILGCEYYNLHLLIFLNLEIMLQDKALLNKPAADRTDHEKKLIYRKIGGLKCFKMYPDVSINFISQFT